MFLQVKMREVKLYTSISRSCYNPGTVSIMWVIILTKARWGKGTNKCVIIWYGQFSSTTDSFLQQIVDIEYSVDTV